MAAKPMVATPAKALSVARQAEKTRKPVPLAPGVKKLLGITDRSDLIKGDEPYFGL